MKCSRKTLHLPESLKDAARKVVTSEYFQVAEKNYETWSNSLPAETSTLNHRLYFLELLEEASGNQNLKKNEELISAVLDGSGVRKVGDSFDRVGPNKEKKNWTVIWRKIGPRYGIQFGLKSEDGDLLSSEFYD